MMIEAEQTCDDTQAHNSTWMRRNLRDSVYLWACGEKADDEDHEPNISDRLIGWLILLMQAFAYTMLTLLARTTFKSDGESSANHGRQSTYLLPAVTGAMYLLVSSTAHDLRAGFSMLVNGRCAGQRTFGFGLLVVYGVMVTAAMTVLASTSEDSASVLLNAVAVLFIADLDENALKLLATVPQKRRLFWAIESVGISFALALIAIFHIGGASPLLKENNQILQTVFEPWSVWGLNPTGVTLASLMLSSTLQGICHLCSGVCESVVKPTFTDVSAKVFHAVWALTVKRVKESFAQEPFFHVILSIWFADGLVMWCNLQGVLDNSVGWTPTAFELERVTPASEDTKLILTNGRLKLLFMNAVLAFGLAVKLLLLICHKRWTSNGCFQGGQTRDRAGSCADSRAPSLLIGWGVAYWVLSFLYMLAVSWHGGSWNNAPLGVTLAAYIIIPCFLLAGMFMVADSSFLRTTFGACVQSAVGILNNRRRVCYWLMLTVFRDILIYWTVYCAAIRYAFMYWGSKKRRPDSKDTLDCRIMFEISYST